MNAVAPLLFAILLYLALEARARRSTAAPWRPGEDLRRDRDESRRVTDLRARTESTEPPRGRPDESDEATVARQSVVFQTTAKCPMPRVVS